MHNDNYKIGWVAEARWPYGNVQASTRIRCLDIINFLRKQNIKTGLYWRFGKYDVVIFQKSFSEKHYAIARKLRSSGTKIILDVNVNYFEKQGETTQVTENQIRNIHRFLGLTATVLVSSPYLKDVAEKYHPDVRYIPEHIGTIGVHPSKTLSNPIKLLYCGYAVKANCVLLISDVLDELSKECDFEMLFVCDKDPSLKLPFRTSFIRYNQRNLINLLRQGDIKIAPRKLDNSYDFGHSFTKIGYPMSVGLPVVASPVPSYQGSPALLASNDKEWLQHLGLLTEDAAEYQRLSQAGMSFVRDNYSLQRIGKMYLELFSNVLDA